MNYIVLKKEQYKFLHPLLTILFIFCLGNSGCKPRPSNKNTHQTTPAIKKHSFEVDLIVYVDSAAQLMNRKKQSEHSLYLLTARFAEILPLNIYKDGIASPDSALSVSIHPAGKTTAETLDISIPRQLKNQLTFKTFTDHFGVEDKKDARLDEFESAMPVAINLNHFLHRSDNAIKLDITADNSTDPKKNRVYQITLAKWTEK